MAIRSNKICLYDESKIKEINPDNIKLLNKYKMDMTIRELSPNTVAAYESDLKQWFIYILDNQFNQSVIELTEDDITEFFYFCKVNGNNSNRMRRRMSSISAFYKFIRKKKLILENPTEFLDRPKHGTPIVTQTFLTKEQVSLLRRKLGEYGDLQLKTYVMFSLSTMARVSAIAHLKWEQIDFKNRVVSNVLEKEGKIVDLFFSIEVRDLLLKLLDYREDHNINDYGWVFYTPKCTETKPISKSTLNDWSHIAGSLINVDTLHPHDFRHSGATILKNEGMSLEDVSVLLNHESVDTTRKFYIKSDTKRISDLKNRINF